MISLLLYGAAIAAIGYLASRPEPSAAVKGAIADGVAPKPKALALRFDPAIAFVHRFEAAASEVPGNRAAAAVVFLTTAVTSAAQSGIAMNNSRAPVAPNGDGNFIVGPKEFFTAYLPYWLRLNSGGDNAALIVQRFAEDNPAIASFIISA